MLKYIKFWSDKTLDTLASTKDANALREEADYSWDRNSPFDLDGMQQLMELGAKASNKNNNVIVVEAYIPEYGYDRYFVFNDSLANVMERVANLPPRDNK